MWDYDLASQPTLVDLQHDGETIAAVLQGTKTGMIFSFDRATGEPILGFLAQTAEILQWCKAGTDNLTMSEPQSVDEGICIDV